MLRFLVIGLGLLSLVCGLAALATGAFPPAIVFGFWGAMIVLTTVFERVIYKHMLPARPGPGWERTPERFVDDRTGEPVTVYIEPRSGERAYVQE
ncbi:MAG: hypothetical protein WDM91_06660 [Rhizomicrobium sp.]